MAWHDDTEGKNHNVWFKFDFNLLNLNGNGGFFFPLTRSSYSFAFSEPLIKYNHFWTASCQMNFMSQGHVRHESAMFV